MAIKSAWAYRERQLHEKEVREFMAEKDRKKAEEHAKALPALKEKRRLRAAAIRDGGTKFWNGLKAGDSLEFFNIPNFIIKKKNKKSVLGAEGNKIEMSFALNQLS